MRGPHYYRDGVCVFCGVSKSETRTPFDLCPQSPEFEMLPVVGQQWMVLDHSWALVTITAIDEEGFYTTSLPGRAARNVYRGVDDIFQSPTADFPPRGWVSWTARVAPWGMPVQYWNNITNGVGPQEPPSEGDFPTEAVSRMALLMDDTAPDGEE